MKTIPVETLLILGNGFDLKCELESKFSHFYTNYIEKYNHKLDNIWYFIFYSSYYDNLNARKYPYLLFPKIKKDDIRWMDVEALIKNIVIGYIPNSNEYYFPNQSYMAMLLKVLQNITNYEYLATSIQCSSLKTCFRNTFQEKEIGLNALYNYLFKQLLLFEKDFAEYIKSIAGSEDYKTKSSLLLQSLLGNDFYFYLLNFNYTSSTIVDTISFCCSDNYNAIHGDIIDKQGIIIGFDSSDCVFDDYSKNGMLCTKTYQKLIRETEAKELPKTIKKIICYGHSLGKQDYSYFHSLFTIYDILNSDVALVFYYSIHGKTKEEQDKNVVNYRTNVIALLNDYSKKSGIGSIECDTLVNKLILENRLTITKLKDTPMINKDKI